MPHGGLGKRGEIAIVVGQARRESRSHFEQLCVLPLSPPVVPTRCDSVEVDDGGTLRRRHESLEELEKSCLSWCRSVR